MRIKLKPLAIACSLIGLLPLSVWSATPINLRHQSIATLQTFAAHQPPLDASLEQLSTQVDFKKNQHVHYQQKFHGYPVWGAEAIVHLPAQGTATFNLLLADQNKSHMNGTIYQNLAPDLASAAPEKFGAMQKTKVLDHAVNYYQSHAKQTAVITRRNANLIVYVDTQNKAHWAYYVSFTAQNDNMLPAKPVYILDATTYEIYRSWNNLQTVDKETVEGGGYGGNSKIGEVLYDGERGDATSLQITRDATTSICYLQNALVTVKDITKNDAVVQYACAQKNAKHGETYWNEQSYFDQLGAFSPDNDVFYHANTVSAMYQSWYHLPVLIKRDNQPMRIVINTHLNVSNASWQDDSKELMFGDGDNKDFLPFTSLDIVGHELGHGFTNQHANLVYDGQSGGLNEAFSDMSGVASVYFATGKSVWKNGADITLTRDALRFFDNPRQDCIGIKPDVDVFGKKMRACSIDHIKDFREGKVNLGPYEFPLVDVHFSSGIFNKAFYLMAQGWGGDANAGTRKAFDVMVQANLAYWTPTTTFAEAACGVMDATHDYGYDAQVVTKAMAAVGLDTSKC